MPPERRPRRRVRRRRRLPRFLIALVIVLALGTIAAMLVNGEKKTTAPPVTTKTVQRTHGDPVAQPVQRDLTEKVTGSLSAPLMDPSYVASGGGIVLLGGLNAADTSVDTVIAAGYHGGQSIARLPSVRHDTAAAVINRDIYVFGGGNGPSQLSDIVRVDPRSGHFEPDRAPAGGELRLDRRDDRRHRVRRRRLHRHALARHDRRLAARQRRARRRASAEDTSLRGGNSRRQTAS